MPAEVARATVVRILLVASLVTATPLTAWADPAGPKEAERACRESVRKHFEPARPLFDARHRSTKRQKLVTDEDWPATTSDIAVPVVKTGWREVDRPSVRLAINAAGAMSLPSSMLSTPAPSEIVSREEMAGRLQRALREGRPAGRQRVTIAADRSVRASVVVDVARRVPPGTPVALVVGKPPADVAREHRRIVPFSPPRVLRAIEKAVARERHHLLALAGEPDLLAEMWRSFGDCKGIKETWQYVGQGMGPETFFPRVSSAVEACRCRNVDVPTLASVMIFVFYLSEDNGWIPLDAAALRTASTLKADASLDDLARALTRR